MNQEVLLKQVKQAVHEVKPDAQIILFLAANICTCVAAMVLI
jgi:hypothetical protein